MASPGFFKWFYECGSNVVQSDGFSCVMKAETQNQLLLIVGIALVAYGVYKKDKVVSTTKKAYSSFRTMFRL